MPARSGPRTKIQLYCTSAAHATHSDVDLTTPGTLQAETGKPLPRENPYFPEAVKPLPWTSISAESVSSADLPEQSRAQYFRSPEVNSADTCSINSDSNHNDVVRDKKDDAEPKLDTARFFHHEIVPVRGASVKLRGSNFIVGTSDKPIAAPAEAIRLRREWEIEKRNYRKKLDWIRMKGTPRSLQNRGGSGWGQGKDDHIPENYIPRDVTDNELFVGVNSAGTGNKIDDCMEAAVRCVFQGREDPPPQLPDAVVSLDDLHLPRKMRENLQLMKIEELFPVQCQVIPLIRRGFDVTGVSPTGSGKTAAFLLPIIECLAVGKGNIRGSNVTRALIICPSHELVGQICETARQMAYGTGVTCAIVHGAIQSGYLRSTLASPPDIIIATPGRLWETLQSHLVSLSQIKFIVIDEVDLMISARSFPEVTKILEHPTFPAVDRRQTLFFSATIPEDQLVFLNRHQSRAFSVRVGTTGLSWGITQIFEKTAGFFAKIDKLRIYLDNAAKEEKTVIVFGGTKSTVDRLHEYLKGFTYVVIHGYLSQAERSNALERFNSKEVLIIVTTDLLSRGLDIEGVGLIINVSMPRSPDVYIHRIGRSGRKGHDGTSVTFYDPDCRRDNSLFEPLFQRLKQAEVSLPTWIDDEIVQVRHARLNNGFRKMDEPDFTDAEDLADMNIFLTTLTTIPVVTCEWLLSR